MSAGGPRDIPAGGQQPPTIQPRPVSSSAGGPRDIPAGGQQQSTMAPDSVMGRGMRSKLPFTRLKDFITCTTMVSSSSKSPSLSAPTPTVSSGTPFPIAHYVSCDKFSLRHRHFLAAITAGTEPQSFKEAMRHPEWQQAMQNEIQSLEKNGT